MTCTLGGSVDQLEQAMIGQQSLYAGHLSITMVIIMEIKVPMQGEISVTTHKLSQ
jgi:hypothetical protein